MKMEFEGDKLVMWEERPMSYRPNREESDAGVRKLAENYPQCFFLDPRMRRPLKKTIIADLIKDGAPMAPELIASSVEWYQSHFGYHYSLKAGAKRIDLNGKPIATVTEQEERAAQKYISERHKELNIRNSEFSPPRLSASIIKAPVMKSTKPIEPIAHLRELFDAVLRDQPEQLRIAGLRVVVTEIEKCIEALERK